MSAVGAVVAVKGERYRIVKAESMARYGAKFYGRFHFRLVKLSDSTRWEAYGKRVTGNTKLTECASSEVS